MTQWCRAVLWCSTVGVSTGWLPAQASAVSSLAAESHVPVHAPASEQKGLPDPAQTLEDALHEAFRSADIVFTGELLAIEHAPDAVVLRWRVEEGVRGVSSGTTYAQREWAGLWSASTGRYTAGQRALVLLHAPSAAGYTSPVGGLDGIIPLRGSSGSSTVDLRWMSQHVAVTDGPRLRPMLALRAAGGSFAASTALQEAEARSAATVRLPRARSIAPGTPPDGRTQQASGDANAHVDGAMVLQMLHAWQRAAGSAQ